MKTGAAVAMLGAAMVWRWQWVRARRVRWQMLHRMQAWFGRSNP